MEFSKKTYLYPMLKITTSLIISLGIVFAAANLGTAWQKSHYSYQSIKVTGLAQRNFTSDLIVWSSNFSRKALTLTDANNLIKKDIALVKAFLIKNGLTEEAITFSALRINRDYEYKYDQNGRAAGQEFTGFNLTQEVSVESKELGKVEAAYKDAGSLIDAGIEFISGEPDYYFSKLSDLKIELLSEATKDGLNRASRISENAGGGTGHLKNASMGVIQITGQNSVEDYSWDGAFNTKAKNKTATVTVKLEFDIN